ncbi:hypothetical protein [uncultured Croceicoccus sp.]|uniref:hypothetical protein n=1 Tax=uncultured Croceicoccus sp. TaxID=1295329 RepID=UPI00262C1249|nr:hypothetical protein [uncultured Croceicoccus sp.]
MRRFAAICIPLAMAACVPAPVTEAPADPAPVTAPVSGPQSVANPRNIDPAACEASGGHVDRRGRGQFETCVHPYGDAGQSCTDNQQCDGKCVAEPDAGMTGVVGECQADDALFGCYAEVVDGAAVRAICVD